jgi:hypothetical protein
MRQVKDYGDDRQKGSCVHCGGPYETDDHMPSKVFLDRPLPENLPVSPSCANCNEGFSKDEEYLACLLECVLAGSTDPDRIGRPSIARKLRDQPALQARLDTARYSEGGALTWRTEPERVQNVIMKLARGHAAFEWNEPRLDDAVSISITPLPSMTRQQREAFEHEAPSPAVWPELGSRGMMKMLVLDNDVFEEGWQLVQEGLYRYRVQQDGGLRVKLVIREYLAGEVCWD